MMLALALMLVVVVPSLTEAGEITVLCARGVQQAVAAAAEDFQRDTRHSVWFSYGTTGTIAGRALTDEADIVIDSAASLGDLETQGALRPRSRVVLGRVGAVTYAAAVLKRTTEPEVAQAFLAHLKSSAARKHFEASGIDPAN